MSIFPSVSSQKLFRRRLPVNRRIGRIVKLLRHPCVLRLRDNRLGLRDGSLHPLGSGREDELRSQHRQQRATLDAHRLGHRQDELVSLRSGDEGERDAGVSARRLDDGRVGVDHAPLLGVLDHRHADAVLHAAERIKKFALHRDGRGQVFRDVIQPDERRATDRFDDVVVDFAHGNRP